MNRHELQDALRNDRIRDDAYDLSGGHLSETYTLGEADGTWFYYYSERGLESDRKEFDTETEACEYFINRLGIDPSTRM